MRLQYLDPKELLSRLREPEVKIGDPEPDEDLVESIRNVGVRTPILVDYNHVIIDGVRRYRAVRILLSEGAELPPIPVIVLEDVDYEKSPEEALLRAFLINRYRRGSDDRYFNTDVIADLLTKYAFTIAKPVEKQDLKRGTIPNSLCRKLAKLVGYSERHVARLLERGLARWKLTRKFPSLEIAQPRASMHTFASVSTSRSSRNEELEDSSTSSLVKVQKSSEPDETCTMRSVSFSSSYQFQSTPRKIEEEVEERSGPGPRVSDDVFVRRVIECGRKLHLMSKLILGILPKKVAECVAGELGYSIQHVYDRFRRLEDIVVREANRIYASSIKISQEKARVILELPDEFIRWLEEQAPLFLKRFFEYLDAEDIRQVYNLWRQGREYEALSLALSKIKEEHKERYEHRRYSYRVEVPGFLLEVVSKIADRANSTVDTVLWQCFKLSYVILKLVLERDIDARYVLQLIEDLYLSSTGQVDVVKLHNFLKVLTG